MPTLNNRLYFTLKATEKFWSRSSNRHLLKIFKQASHKIPAYKKFLQQNNIKPGDIKTFKDWGNIPSTSRKNYLNLHPWEHLLWPGSLHQTQILGATSGSSGQPFYFPRTDKIDTQSALFHSLWLNSEAGKTTGKTLVVDGFGMGVWVGGMITYSAFRKISGNSGPFSIITTGSNKKEIFDAIKCLSPNYDQIILCGYPPFIKDVIDEGEDQGINWRKRSIKILFAAEAFSEKFRDYIAYKTGIKHALTQTANIYGSADLGTMAIETPISILARRLALKDPKLYKSIFPNTSRLPTLAQFNPLYVNFETQNGEILLTGNSTLPLIKYEIGDKGGVLAFTELLKIFAIHGINLKKMLTQQKLWNKTPKWPFVYVFERSDLSIKLYGAIIYPEHIKTSLQNQKFNKYLTGKFTLETKTNKKHEQILFINLEQKLKRLLPRALKNELKKTIVQNLKVKNAEYGYLFSLMPKKVLPNIVLLTHGDKKYFSSHGKQAWVKK